MSVVIRVQWSEGQSVRDGDDGVNIEVQAQKPVGSVPTATFGSLYAFDVSRFPTLQSICPTLHWIDNYLYPLTNLHSTVSTCSLADFSTCTYRTAIVNISFLL